MKARKIISRDKNWLYFKKIYSTQTEYYKISFNNYSKNIDEYFYLHDYTFKWEKSSGRYFREIGYIPIAKTEIDKIIKSYEIS